MDKEFPNIEQYSDEELDYLIQAAITILNAHQSKTIRCDGPPNASV